MHTIIKIYWLQHYTWSFRLVEILQIEWNGSVSHFRIHTSYIYNELTAQFVNQCSFITSFHTFAKQYRSNKCRVKTSTVKDLKVTFFTLLSITTVEPVKCYWAPAESSSSWVIEHWKDHRSLSRSRKTNAHLLIVCHWLVHALVVTHPLVPTLTNIYCYNNVLCDVWSSKLP